MINKEQMNILQHDLKRASKVLELVATESSKDKRNLLLSLVTDELDRLHKDLDNLAKNGGK